MKIISFLLGIFLFNLGYGQESKRITYQFDIGTTISIPYKSRIEIWPEYVDHPITDYKPNFGYFGEILVGYNLNNRFSLFTGVNFLQSILKIDDKEGFLEIKGNIKSTYLNFPILAKFQFSKNLPLKIGIGTYFSTLLISKEKGTANLDESKLHFPQTSGDPSIPTGEYTQDLDIKDRYKSYDFGMSSQLDYDLRLSDKILGVFFTRFNYGLIDVLKNQNNYKWKNYSLLIGFGIKI